MKTLVRISLFVLLVVIQNAAFANECQSIKNNIQSILNAIENDDIKLNLSEEREKMLIVLLQVDRETINDFVSRKKVNQLIFIGNEHNEFFNSYLRSLLEKTTCDYIEKEDTVVYARNKIIYSFNIYPYRNGISILSTISKLDNNYYSERTYIYHFNKINSNNVQVSIGGAG